MCEICFIDENGCSDRAKALFDIRSKAKVPEAFYNLAETDGMIWADEPDPILLVTTRLFGQEVICDQVRINFCPICGRDLRKENT